MWIILVHNLPDFGTVAPRVSLISCSFEVVDALCRFRSNVGLQTAGCEVKGYGTVVLVVWTQIRDGTSPCYFQSSTQVVHHLPPVVMPSLIKQPPSSRFPWHWINISEENSLSYYCHDGVIQAKRKNLSLRRTGCSCISDPRAVRASPSRRQLVGEPDYHLESQFQLLKGDKEELITNSAHLNGHRSCRWEVVSNKVVIAVDVDEVLGNFLSALNNFIRDRYAANHSMSEYHVYEFFKIWKCSREEANFRVHQFFDTPYFKAGIHPIPGAKKVLHKLSRLCNLAVVTSRQHVIKDHTVEWIENHFPGLFQEMHFGNHFALTGESRSKSEICKSLGATVLIDDNPKYARECAEVGIKVMLFDFENSYPWCKTDTRAIKHPLITKVHNWEEVEKEILSQVLSESIIP